MNPESFQGVRKQVRYLLLQPLAHCGSALRWRHAVNGTIVPLAQNQMTAPGIDQSRQHLRKFHLEFVHIGEKFSSLSLEIVVFGRGKIQDLAFRPLCDAVRLPAGYAVACSCYGDGDFDRAISWGER